MRVNLVSSKGHDFHFQIPKWPVNLWEKLRRLAQANRRTIKQEALIAIEGHLQRNELLTEDELKKLH